MKNALLLSLALGTLSLTAQAGNCPDIRNQIDTKLKAKGLHHYSLDVVSAGSEGGARVVGKCNGGKSVIVYARGAGAAKVAAPSAAAPAASASPAAPRATRPAKAAKPAAPPALGNY